MTDTVVEVGPAAVRGQARAEHHLESTALEYIDDEIAVLDEQPVAVPAVWRQVFSAVLPERVETAVLVCPTWWPPPRIARVREAAAARSTKVVVLQRADVLVVDVPGVPAVVEIAPEFVVVWRSGGVVAAVPRLGDDADVARSVADGVGPATTVLVDAPLGVAGAVELALAISGYLRADGVAVTTVAPDRVLAAARDSQTPLAHEPAPTWPRGRRIAALTAVAASVALLCLGLGFVSGTDEPEEPDVPMTLLVEGRVAVKVPALWQVQRITSGPGSARVQVMAPDNSTAVLLTQSQVRWGETLSATSATLRSALDDQQPGVFSGFKPDDRRADRPATTYRERRGGRQIDWTVFVDDTVRIGIGCQSAPGGEDAVRYVCEEAIRSAHALV
ncbi:type VII secretion-associated protein [Mycolicibacterium stellerae]|uniref:type VII secretion-associated protein n=1 Tax=Mycolicibacterium stellerae TaxID=2358193 RepID=UPI0013DE5D83|nr:type VII secretion-associated protein [Mycolicibacterium stellerae]